MDKIMKRDLCIDNIKGIAIIFVIIGHAINLLLLKENLSFAWKNIFDVIYTFHMPFFFIASGYLCKVDRKEKVKDIIIKNLFSFYLPYLFLNYMYWFERVVASEIFRMQLSQEVSEVSVGNFFRLLYDAGNISWFLLSIFLVKSIFCIGCKYSSYLVTFIIFLVFFWSSFFVDFEVLYYLGWGVFFSIGYLLKQINLCALDLLRRRILSIICLNFLMIGIVRLSENGLDFIVRLLVGVASFILLLVYLNMIDIHKSSIICKCGEYSMVIYIIHGLSQYITYYLIKNIFCVENGVMILGGMLLVQLILALFIVYLFTKIKCFEWIQFFFYPYRYIKKVCFKKNLNKEII